MLRLASIVYLRNAATLQQTMPEPTWPSKTDGEVRIHPNKAVVTAVLSILRGFCEGISASPLASSGTNRPLRSPISRR